ncbi:MFS transporter [Lolliginicoccus suaedae]|uniref:MFS transporter n=1 Tax=Lolliginicoccus suaedae TaxID=2605429 RepID=UPI0011EDE9FC|nr:MFS transporter [Lolliginicoccus suaedae]
MPPPTTAAASARPLAPHGVDSRGYRAITVALFIAGVTTFGSMYSTQAVLPELSRAFGVAPATSALAMSVTTGTLALAIIPASALSSRFGRTRVMTISAIAAAVIGLLVPLSPTLATVLVLRALQGLALAGVPAVAMAYLAEEIEGASLGQAMGRYIAGTTVGALLGRILASGLLDVTSWRWALEATALVAAGSAIVMMRMLPPSRMFVARPVSLRATARQAAGHLRDSRMLALFAVSFLLMGAFVSMYNFLGYRLLGEPFGLAPALAGLVFLFYLSGTVSSPRAGRLADRFGRRGVLIAAIALMLLGTALALPATLPTLLAGIAVLTTGFFAAHAVASSWVGVLARRDRAEASSLYLAAYYTGSAVLGGGAGIMFDHGGWAGLVAHVGACVMLALVVVISVLPRSVGRSG